MADLNIQGIASTSATARGMLIKVAPGQGYETWLGFGQELTYGSAVSRTKFIEIVSESVKRGGGVLPKASLRGPFSRGYIPARKVVGGDIVTELFFEGHERLLRQVFGKVETSIVEAGKVWDHVFTPFSPVPTGLTLEVNRDVGSFVYPGGKINMLALSMVLDQVFRATYSVGAADEEVAVASSPNFPAELLPSFHAAELKVDNIAEDVNDFNVSLNNNLGFERYKLNALVMKEPVRNALGAVEGAFTGDFADLRQYTKFTSRTPVAVKLTVLGDLIPTTAHYYTITVEIPRAVYEGETPGVDGPGIIGQNFPFKGYASEDLATPPIRMTIRNTIETI